MAKAKTVSDSLAKAKCREWLQSIGFTDVKPARKQSCDLTARKSGETYFIEIKYSSKEEGPFFGTVMLTEMFKAISNKDSYLFLVCRGKTENLGEWSFKLFSVDEFLQCCTLTTPIFLYNLNLESGFHLSPPTFSKNTVLASEELVRQMWKDFVKWKSSSFLRRGNQL